MEFTNRATVYMHKDVYRTFIACLCLFCIDYLSLCPTSGTSTDQPIKMDGRSFHCTVAQKVLQFSSVSSM
ncbi:hypothetical protein GDO81_021016 [Engystomops pustulosus]|uniref:Secreted protein n=1 Tax=Engystomops pustulosus TaxID=76066 RepID=A0AAV6ZQC0_ENGPU|nr:hypothetical protein GDO81_021016 [Engystomops pustulosus]